MKKLRSSVLLGLMFTLVLGLSLVMVPIGSGSGKTVHASSSPSIFTFVVINGTDCDVRLADKTVTRAIVPDKATINGVEYTVTTVAASGFANSPNLEKVRLPKTIKTIGTGAFLNCVSLESITLPAVETINTNAFGFTNLDHIIIPETATSVAATILRSTNTKVYVRGPSNQPGWNGNWNGNNSNTAVEYNSTFMPEIQYRYEENFAPISFGFGFSPFSTTGGYVVDDYQLFITATGVDIYIPAEYMGEPVIGISDYAFFLNDCDSITIAYSDTPIRIGAWAFWGYDGNTITINRDIVFEDDWGSPSEYVFAFSTASTIVLPDTLTELGEGAFQYSEVENIHFVTPELLTQSEEEALAGTLVSTNNVFLPDTLTSIGTEAFSGTNNILELHIPDSVSEVGQSAFVGWNVPQEIHIDFADEISLPVGWNALWKSGIGNLSIINYSAPQIFDITYYLYGGVHTGNPDTYTPKDSLITLNDATRTGYIFNGWFTALTNGTQVLSIATGTTGDIELHAVWTAITYTVTYNSNKPSAASGTVTGATSNSTHMYNVPSALQANGFSLAGWTFTGAWKDATGNTYLDGSIIENFTAINGATITLFAQWIANDYTITYHGNRPDNASSAVVGSMANTDHKYDTASSLRANAFSLTGWTFTGWMDASGNSYAQNAQVNTVTTSGTVVLFAQWIQNTYNVAYNANKQSNASGNVGGTMSNSSHTYDSPSNLSSNAYSLYGWDFAGWNTEANGSGSSYSNGQAVATVIASGTRTLYAQWTAKTYNVSYNSNRPTNASNNVSGSMANTAHTFDTASNLRANAFNLHGWNFVGWNTQANGSGTSYSAGASMTTVLFDGTVTLYAQWQAITYTIAYGVNGGSGSMANTTHTFDTASNLRANSFTRTGYRFVNWRDASGNTYSDGQSMTTVLLFGTVTLQAQWAANTYTVVYHGNGATGGSMANTSHTYGTAANLRANAFENVYTSYMVGTTYEKFLGWSLSANGSVAYGNSASVSNLTADHGATVNLYARWEPGAYALEVHTNAGGNAFVSRTTVYFDNDFTITAPSKSGYTFEFWTCEVPIYGTMFIMTYDYSYSSTWTVNINYAALKSSTNSVLSSFIPREVRFYANYKQNSSCVADGTLITLADGTQKAVEDLDGTEMLLVWNMKTGAFDVAPILFIDNHGVGTYDVTRLYFSDGTDVKVIWEHGFWSATQNKYVYITDGNAEQFLGEWFNKQITNPNGSTSWTTVQLVNVVRSQEITNAWSPITFSHLNYYVNGMLSVPAKTGALTNIFYVDETTMQICQVSYLADIAQYGLFDYATDFAEILPIELFVAFNVQYLKVSIGKGIMTQEDLDDLIAEFYETMARLFGQI